MSVDHGTFGLSNLDVVLSLVLSPSGATTAFPYHGQQGRVSGFNCRRIGGDVRFPAVSFLCGPRSPGEKRLNSIWTCRCETVQTDCGCLLLLSCPQTEPTSKTTTWSTEKEAGT